MKILVAEDNFDSRELLQDILSGQGYIVHMAFDGVNALELIAQQIPDLLILDVDMPRKDGFEVVKSLKQDVRTASIPIIMLTARSDVENRVHGLGLGADDYLAKPFSPRELLARVNTRLRAKAETDGLREQRELIRRTFSRFVAQEIIDLMMENPSAIQLGGQLRPLTVLFVDLEGFTSISEHENPVDLLDILNQYHGFLVNIIKRNGGTIDKFLGDGLMALFNAPIDLEQHVFRAVKSALEIKNELPNFYEQLPQRFQLQVNIGIHSGLAVVGNIGASDLMDYTAVGDTVNLAARLQGLSQQGQISVSKAVYDVLQDQIEAEDLGDKQIKGREESVRVYHVIGFKAHD